MPYVDATAKLSTHFAADRCDGQGPTQVTSGLFASGAGGYRPSAEYTRALADSKLPAPELEVTALLKEAVINPEETYTLSFDNAGRSNHGPPSPFR